MRGKSVVASAVASMALLGPALAQQVPGVPEDVARPGGDLPGDPKIALVKIADGFNDPINVTNAGDGSGRIFVVERVGRVRVVQADGSVQLEPFLDLTNINPLGNDVQTGFVEQGLYAIAFHPNFEENGYFYVHYASLPFNGDVPEQPNRPYAIPADNPFASAADERFMMLFGITEAEFAKIKTRAKPE